MASFGPEIADGHGRSVVTVRVGDKEDKFALCALNAGKSESTTLDVHFMGEEKVTFETSGKNDVHLVGNFSFEGDDDEDDSDDEGLIDVYDDGAMEDDDEDEDDDVEAPTLMIDNDPPVITEVKDDEEEEVKKPKKPAQKKVDKKEGASEPNGKGPEKKHGKKGGKGQANRVENVPAGRVVDANAAVAAESVNAEDEPKSAQKQHGKKHGKPQKGSKHVQRGAGDTVKGDAEKVAARTTKADEDEIQPAPSGKRKNELKEGPVTPSKKPKASERPPTPAPKKKDSQVTDSGASPSTPQSQKVQGTSEGEDKGEKQGTASKSARRRKNKNRRRSQGKADGSPNS